MGFDSVSHLLLLPSSSLAPLLHLFLGPNALSRSSYLARSSRIERLLTLPPPPAPPSALESDAKDQPTSDLPYEIQGLLLVSIAGLRDVGKNEFNRREGGRKAVSFFFLLFFRTKLLLFSSRRETRPDAPFLSLNRLFPSLPFASQEFMLDLLDLENPEVIRDAKLRVVERMWRCWGGRLGWVGRDFGN